MKTGFTFIFIILLSVLCVNETNRTESIAPGVEITDTIFSTEFYSRGSNTVSLSMAGNLSCREKFIRSKKV
ncbi:MAG: hypothetical protein WCI71_04180, partial [Bacteroidota bacterium]